MASSAFPLIVFGASAGGVEALRTIFAGLPEDLRAALFVVLHLRPFAKSRLPEILSHAGTLPAHNVHDSEPIKPGQVYVAPPNCQMVIEGGNCVARTAPKENHFCPAINPLFRTAAQSYGPRVIGVILSGLLNDGTAGLSEIKRRGGLAVVQSPEDAQHPQMSLSAIEHVAIDYTVPANGIAKLLGSLCKYGTAGLAQDKRSSVDPVAPSRRSQKQPSRSIDPRRTSRIR
jgi:two-component system, chemotaxis family, protein-glutamate methylesterase/glutaminase